MIEVELQVGRMYVPDQEIGMEVMKFLMEKTDMKVKGKVSLLERRYFTKNGDFFMSIFLVLLRRIKGSIIDAAVLRHHID